MHKFNTMTNTKIREQLKLKQLKVTPQRTAILEAIITLSNHPTVDEIIDYVRKNQPDISIATVYKVLHTFTEKGIIHKVKTDKDILRYDADLSPHHHLYFSKSDTIKDFHDENLNQLLYDYFREHNIPNFKIEDIKLQISGDYIK